MLSGIRRLEEERRGGGEGVRSGGRENGKAKMRAGGMDRERGEVSRICRRTAIKKTYSLI